MGASCQDCAELQPGSVVYCLLLLRGVVKAVEAMLVDVGKYLSVVACPASVGITSSGDWCAETDMSARPSFTCRCADSDLSCEVVFYSIQTDALSLVAFPETWRFSSTDGREGTVVPRVDALVALLRGDAGEDALQVRAVPSGYDLQQCTPLFEVHIGSGHVPLLWNSVLVVPDFITKEDCHILIDAADRSVRAGTSASNFYAYQGWVA